VPDERRLSPSNLQHSISMPSLPPVKRFESRAGLRIYRIACDVLPGLSGRVHLLLGAGPPTLIDTGSGQGESTSQILSGLELVSREFGEKVRLADIGRILITHSHVDHIGGLADLLPQTRAEVGVHPLDRRAIVAFDEHAITTGLAMRNFFRQAGIPLEEHGPLLDRFGMLPGRVRSARVDFDLVDGMELDGLKVVHVPGHSPGLVCLATEEILLCSDHILPVTVPQQWPESTGAYNGLGHYLESLEKIRRLPGIELALGGHEMAIHDVKQRADQIRDTQFRRLERAVGLLDKAPSPLTIHELGERMYTQATGFHSVLALMDAGSRVEYLHQRGRLAIANLDELRRNPAASYRYRPA